MSAAVGGLGLRIRRGLLGLVSLGLLALSGCASGPGAHPSDPLEPFNRSMYNFNDALDRNLLKPVATAYRDVTPSPVRKGVANFFNNLEDAWSFVNSVLQLKPQSAVDNLMRVGINTVFGLGGILDLASELKIERHAEDFGQTLGRWGVGAGPYVVLPFLGPTTLRDATALSVDFRGDAVNQQTDIPLRNSLWVTRLVDKRAQLLRAGSVLDEAALDKYSFVRDAFLARRQYQVYDGNPPEEPEPAADAPEPQDPPPQPAQ